MTPDDLALLRPLTDPRLSPDGRQVVYVVGELDLDEDEQRSRLHLMDLDSGRDRRLTAGPVDSSPRWSPDGSRIAFVRTDGEEPGQLAVIDPAGGEARIVSAVPEGVAAPAWAPDGRTVVVASRRWRDGDHERSAADRAERPRRITELRYRHDDVGWTHDRVRRLFAVDVDAPEVVAPAGSTDTDGTHADLVHDADADLVDAAGDPVGGAPVPLTPADVDVSAHVVTTGGRVVFASARHDEREVEPATGVWATTLDGDGDGDGDGVGASPAGLTELLAPRALWGIEAGRDDDVLLVGDEDAFAWPAPPGVQRLDADGETHDLTPDLDRDVGEVVALAGGDVLVTVEDRGAVHLRRVAADGAITDVVDGARTVTAVDASADSRTIVFVATHPEDPGELWVLDGDEPRVLTDHNAALRERLLPVEHVTFERGDGVELDAWVLLPAGDAEDVPLLVNIHGGPTAQYGWSFFDEFQVYAAAGYAVVGANPRGASGRGADWATAVVGHWHDEDPVDILDLEAVADAGLGFSDRISPERVGIMGGSYGGYATARIVSRTDRYRSAVVERGLLDWVSFSGTSDIGPYFDRMFLDASFGEDLSRHWPSSPVAAVGRITTPTLVVHSTDDFRCPIEQGLELFQGLRRAGTEAELVIFPGESHELSRSGSPVHRRERFEIILEWHDRHLGVDRDATDAVADGADAVDGADEGHEEA